MDKKRLKELLDIAGLRQKDLASLLGISHVTVNGWGVNQGTPYWVESWVINYIKAKKFDEMIEVARELDRA
jgi:DNA-binding XRE family transcriptional regulator